MQRLLAQQIPRYEAIQEQYPVDGLSLACKINRTICMIHLTDNLAFYINNSAQFHLFNVWQICND